jgi:hypothetical protein
MRRLRKARRVIVVAAAIALPACASGGGGGKVGQVSYDLGGGWGPWGGYRAAPVYVPVDIGPIGPSEPAPEFEATPIPEIPDDGRR